VQFKSNGANLGSPVSLAGGQGSVTVSGSALGAGSFSITAEYADAGGNFNSSTNGLNQVINNPAPAVACKMSLTPQPSGCMTASLTGTPGQTYVLQASTDMIHWAAMSTNVADANGQLSFTDTAAKNYPSRFYRGAMLP
jgi:hypothetical protein